ncbi:hypothetical protein GN956_G18862 [Arapaima gigas]
MVRIVVGESQAAGPARGAQVEVGDRRGQSARVWAQPQRSTVLLDLSGSSYRKTDIVKAATDLCVPVI